MSLELWFRQDIANILLSLNVASAAAAQLNSDGYTAAYRRGYQEALQSAAIALGIPPEKIGIRSPHTVDAKHTQEPACISRLT